MSKLSELQDRLAEEVQRNGAWIENKGRINNSLFCQEVLTYAAIFSNSVLHGNLQATKHIAAP